MRQIPVLIVFLSLSQLLPSESFAISASVPETTVKSKSDVFAQLTGVVPGTELLVESDLSKTSTNAKVDKQGRLLIGQIAEPGVYFVRLINSDQSQAMLCLAVVPAGKGQLTIVGKTVAPDKGTQTKPVASDLLTRFVDAMKKDNYKAAKAAAKTAAEAWLKNNVVSAGATVVVCVLPGGQTACLLRIGDHIVEFGFEYMDALIDECDLSKEDRNALKLGLKTTRFAKDLTNIGKADAWRDKLFAAASAGLTLVEPTEGKDKNGNAVEWSMVANSLLQGRDAVMTLKVVLKKGK